MVEQKGFDEYTPAMAANDVKEILAALDSTVWDMIPDSRIPNDKRDQLKDFMTELDILVSTYKDVWEGLCSQL